MKRAWCSAPRGGDEGSPAPPPIRDATGRSRARGRRAMASSIRPALLAHDLGERDDQLAGDRVALLRHGRGGAAALHERLEHLADLGLHHQHHVGRDLGEAAGDEAEEARPPRRCRRGPTCQVMSRHGRGRARPSAHRAPRGPCRRARRACRPRRRTAPTSTRGFELRQPLAVTADHATSQTAAL